MGTIFQTVEQPQGLQEADDITINTNFNGDAQNITQNTFAYENNGLSFNNIGSMFGNFFDFNTQGNNFRWSSLVDMFGQVGGYNAPRGDVLGLDKPIADVQRDSTGTLGVTATDGSKLDVEVGTAVDENITVDLGAGPQNVKVGNSETDNKYSYDASTTAYVGPATQIDTIQVGASQTADVAIDLNRSTNIDNVDSSQTAANVAVTGANFINNQIAASAGRNVLYGGLGSNDTFWGNVAATSFMELMFGIGSGSDVAYNTKETDLLNLRGTDLSQIGYAGQINEEFFGIQLTTGETLLVDGNKDRQILVQNQGTTMLATYEHNSRSFSMTPVG